VVVGEVTPLHETFKVPPAVTVEELALTLAAPVVVPLTVI
jgi:hypothetical protein